MQDSCSESGHDSEVVADDASGGDAGIGRRRTTGKPQGRKRAAPSRGSGKSSHPAAATPMDEGEDDSAISGADDDARHPECVLCQKDITSPQDLVTKGASRSTYHLECLSAQSYFERHARSRVGAAALSKFKTEKPREFRYKALELLTSSSSSGGGGGAKRRGADDRARTAELCEEISQYSNVYHQRYVFMLGERAFKQWCPTDVSIAPPEWSGVSRARAFGTLVGH